MQRKIILAKNRIKKGLKKTLGNENGNFLEWILKVLVIALPLAVAGYTLADTAMVPKIQAIQAWIQNIALPVL